MDVIGRLNTHCLDLACEIQREAREFKNKNKRSMLERDLVLDSSPFNAVLMLFTDMRHTAVRCIYMIFEPAFSTQRTKRCRVIF